LMRRILVLGAGASADYGMPTGKELVSEVIRCCSDQHPLFAHLLRCGCSEDELTELGRRLRDSEPNSVDFFLTENTKLRRAGKLAIAAVLLSAEKDEEVRESWYKLLSSQMLHDRTLQHSPKVIHVITFNYDRSLEFYFFRVAHAHFEDPAKAALFTFRVIPIHVHGRFVKMPDEDANAGVAYGKAVQAEVIVKSADGILLACEHIGEHEDFRAAQQHLADAEEIVFLGFAFHEDNLRNLKPERWKDRRLIISGYGFNQRERDKLKAAFPSADVGRADEKLPKFLENRELW